MLNQVLEQTEEERFERREVLSTTVEVNEEGAYVKGVRKEGESAAAQKVDWQRHYRNRYSHNGSHERDSRLELCNPQRTCQLIASRFQKENLM